MSDAGDIGWPRISSCWTVGQHVAFLGIVVVLASCATGPLAARDDLAALMTVHYIPAPTGGYFWNQPAWLPTPNEIVVAFDPPGSHGPFDMQLMAVRPDGSAMQTLDLPADTDCKATSANFPSVLPDGRLGYIQGCWGSLSPNRKLPEESTRLMVYDPTTGAAGSLLPYFLPINTKDFTFPPDMHVGVINDGYGLYERLQWLRPDRTEILKLPLARAGLPAWSPDGRQIAVDGVPNDYGKDGVDRLGLPRILYLLSPSDRRLRPLVSGLDDGSEISWSPNSRWLIAELTFKNKKRALWLLEVATGKRHLLFAGDGIGAASWSPDGRHIAAVVGQWAKDGQAPKDRVGLYIIDVPDLTILQTPAKP